MNSTLGKILQEMMQKEGSPSAKDFASMMNFGKRSIYNIYSGEKPLTFEEVIKASKILNFDLIAEYSRRTGQQLISEPIENYNAASPSITVNLTVSGPMDNYKKFPDLLKAVRDKAHELGFIIV